MRIVCVKKKVCVHKYILKSVFNCEWILDNLNNLSKVSNKIIINNTILKYTIVKIKYSSIYYKNKYIIYLEQIFMLIICFKKHKNNT